MIFYKYVPVNRINILSNHHIRFTPMNELNDPFEFHFKVTAPSEVVIDFMLEKHENMLRASIINHSPDLLKDIVNNMATSELRTLMIAHYDDSIFQKFAAWEEIVTNIKNDISTKIGVLSLTKNPSNLLMWSHYTDEHRGMVIGFEIDDMFIQNNVSDCFPVQYQEEIKSIHVTNFKDVQQSEPDMNKQAMSVALTKSQHWAYEEEWRMFTTFEQTNNNDTLGLMKFNPESIREIIFGMNSSEGFQNEVQEILEQNIPNHQCQIKKARSHYNNYKIIIE
ncbi:DUF2971 domain-containing protein [Sulfurimonas sp.]|uniref:DUF2971 domain-containing protein n=1 Tax=Sulfurimonas sp. TaxID=2022749 RepID=UPI003D0C83D9